MHEAVYDETRLGDRLRRAGDPAAGRIPRDTRRRDSLAAWRRSLLRPELAIAATITLLLSSAIGAHVTRDVVLCEAWLSFTILCVLLPWLGYALVQLGLLLGVLLGIVRVEFRMVPGHGRFDADRGCGGERDRG